MTLLVELLERVNVSVDELTDTQIKSFSWLNRTPVQRRLSREIAEASWASLDKPTERQLQRLAVQWLREGCGLVAFHVPLGEKRSGRVGRIAGAVSHGDGTMSGIPDLLCFHGGRVLGIELKRPSRVNHNRGGCSASQLVTHEVLRSVGGISTVVCHSLPSLIEAVTGFFPDLETGLRRG